MIWSWVEAACLSAGTIQMRRREKLTRSREKATDHRKPPMTGIVHRRVAHFRIQNPVILRVFASSRANFGYSYCIVAAQAAI